MAINDLTIPQPDFQAGNVIDPEEFDANNAAIVNKVNEIIADVNTDFVDLTSDQSIDGFKTFVEPVTVPEPVVESDAASKGYVDDVATGFLLGEIGDNSLPTSKDTPEKRTLTINKSYTVSSGTNFPVVTTDGDFDFTQDGHVLSIVPLANNTGAGNITVDGTTKNMKKWDADSDSYVDLEADDLQKNVKADFVWSVSNNFFILAPKAGAGDVTYLKTYLYNGDAFNKYGDLLYATSYYDFVGDKLWYYRGSPYSFASFDMNDKTDELTYTAPSGAWGYAVSVGTDIYVRQIAFPYAIWKYDTLADTWDETLASTIGSYDYLVASGTDIYAKNAVSPYNLLKYDTITDEWTTNLAAPSGNSNYSAVLGDYVYVRSLTVSNQLWRYSISGNTWDETLAQPSVSSFDYLESDGVRYVYARHSNTKLIIRYDTQTDSWDELGNSYENAFIELVWNENTNKLYSRDSSSDLIEYTPLFENPDTSFNIKDEKGNSITVKSEQYVNSVLNPVYIDEGTTSINPNYETFELLSSDYVPHVYGGGLVYYRGYIYSYSSSEDFISKFNVKNPSANATQASETITQNLLHPQKIGDFIYFFDSTNNNLLKYNPKNETTYNMTNSFLSGWAVDGMTAVGNILYGINNSGIIRGYDVSVDDGTFIDVIISGTVAPEPYTLHHIDGYLWYGDDSDAYWHKVEISTGTLSQDVVLITNKSQYSFVNGTDIYMSSTAPSPDKTYKLDTLTLGVTTVVFPAEIEALNTNNIIYMTESDEEGLFYGRYYSDAFISYDLRENVSDLQEIPPLYLATSAEDTKVINGGDLIISNIEEPLITYQGSITKLPKWNEGLAGYGSLNSGTLVNNNNVYGIIGGAYKLATMSGSITNPSTTHSMCTDAGCTTFTNASSVTVTGLGNFRPISVTIRNSSTSEEEAAHMVDPNFFSSFIGAQTIWMVQSSSTSEGYYGNDFYFSKGFFRAAINGMASGSLYWSAVGYIDES